MAKGSQDRRRNSEEVYELKLTPMIDVVFQLLIFFLCATKFPEPEGILKTWLPKEKGQHSDITIIDPIQVRLWLHRSGDAVICEYQDQNSETGFTPFPAAQVYDEHNKRDEIWPNYSQVEAYLGAMKRKFETKVRDPKGLPVTLDFTADVPWKHVARLIDICTGLGLTNIQIAAPEIPYE